MSTPPKISDAERLALQTLWRGDGFVDSTSLRFALRSRLYQWRINLALLIALGLLSFCWLMPDWLVDHLHIHTDSRGWFMHYLMLRGLLAFGCLAIGLYCWQRQRSLLSFWVGFTLFTSTMWALDRWLATSANALPDDVSTPLLWPLRAALIAIGLINIWRHAFTPLPQQRRLFNWRLQTPA